MLARIRTSTAYGIDATSVEVEVQVRAGPPKFTIIGLADSTVRESKDRVVSAIQHSGFQFPDQVLVNLAPAEMRKEGSSFDLPIALGILTASGQVGSEHIGARSFHGELALDGRLKPVRGAIALAIESARSGVCEIIIPHENWKECSLVRGATVYPLGSLSETVLFLKNRFYPLRPIKLFRGSDQRESDCSLAQVWGQECAKRALEIAAAGGHNVLLLGPPGCGKSMLAQRFSSLLPPLSDNEVFETVKIHSVVGNHLEHLLLGQRPFRAPHHVISDVGLVGGGPLPRPGEISLAHNGVLFLDEFPEFRRSAVEALRAPLETGTVRISRARGSLLFPARFQLLAAMNPCPCGRLGLQGNSSVGNDFKGIDTTGGRSVNHGANTICLCSRSAIDTYLRKISQPILDRIDIQVELEPVPARLAAQHIEKGTSTGDDLIRGRIAQARQQQFEGSQKLNSAISSSDIGARVKLKNDALQLVERAAQKTNLSARGFVRVLRVATTIADLAHCSEVSKEHVAEALSFRGMDRLHRYVEQG